MHFFTECMLEWDIKSKQKREYLEQCGHLLAPTKNKVLKHFINTGKFGWRISINQ